MQWGRLQLSRPHGMLICEKCFVIYETFQKVLMIIGINITDPYVSSQSLNNGYFFFCYTSFSILKKRTVSQYLQTVAPLNLFPPPSFPNSNHSLELDVC